MENIILSPISIDNLGLLIQKSVVAALALSAPQCVPVEEDEKLSIEGLATYLNCTKATVHAYKKRGVFPFYQTGRTIYFKKAEVDAALANTKRTTIKK